MKRPLQMAIPCGVEPSFFIFLFLALFFLAILLGAGCSSRDIEGRVIDPFGNGLADVTVQVQKTTFRATSGRDGHYAIDYVPGTFAVEFAKPGYTTQTFELAIQQKMRFPAETVILYPIPNNPGIYYLGDRELVLVPRSTVRVLRIKGEWNKPSEERYYVEGEPSQLTIPAGRTRFIDTDPRHIVLVKANQANMIVHLLKRFGMPEYHYDGSRADEAVKIGREQLVIRSVQLDPGTYAWVEVAPIDPILGGLKPNEKQPSYAFKVYDVAIGVGAHAERFENPVQISPTDGTVFDHYPRRTTLAWRSVDGATSYTAEVDCYQCCQSNQWCADVGQIWLLVPGLPATSYTFDFVGAQPGRWRVWAVDSGGQESPKTNWWEFHYRR